MDYSASPFIEISLPPAYILPLPTLLSIYACLAYVDLFLLRHDHTSIRLLMACIHVLVPMVFISNNPPLNVLIAATPWFLATYSAHMPVHDLTPWKWIKAFLQIIVDKDNAPTHDTIIRLKGLQKMALGVLKISFLHVFVNPLLPSHAKDALAYPWYHSMSCIYTVLFGIKGYCMLGVVDFFIGVEQTIFAWHLVSLFNSPMLASSPRDFWSRRWNRVVRNLLHTQVFTKKAKTSLHKRKKSITVIDQPPNRRITRSITAAAVANAHVHAHVHTAVAVQDIENRTFWSTKKGRGLLTFIISGIFHELIIMSACRKITLENFMFFTLQGVAVMIEVGVRQGPLKREPKGKTRLLCIGLQLLFMSITGRLFNGPFLRYDFF
ncbi:uncharacterized protein B0P05DRAFT_524163 [Gilbertella persicaria]|uniref:Wax synthase domain-containing protein n=1 Tax=Rhizopus stolonifer TaxID=4846 RepID=A0A367KLM3_RHIST|nr:uncharacterized protein B0P05DRAFT_524163 [Gilbertella persicaria]KAI8094979.1 hypothetical protein B0P05DRAFT_524163 [Gilbertella persicaria]RCI03059.1 hypothetical protein CU098_009876 [Rhizopus stolonifer]